MTRAVFGRFFFIALLLVGAAAVALFATRSGYNLARSDPAAGVVTCTYWLGFGLHRTRHEAVEPGFECPLLIRDVAL